MDSELLGDVHSQNMFALYVQDQIQPIDSLALTAGLRYDKHPVTGSNISPRGSIVYSPAKDHAFRVSAARAFRNPSFVHSYVSLAYNLKTAFFPNPINVKLSGNEDISPEWITSFELGYQGTFGSRFRGEIDMFYNKLDNLIDSKIFKTYHAEALFPGSPGGVIPSDMGFGNMYGVNALGGEVAGELLLLRWFSLHGNYSYQHLAKADTDEIVESAPKHKLNPGIFLKFDNLTISLFANYVDKTKWDNVEIDSYAILNSVINYEIFNGKTNLALSVSNLLNNKHMEHPDGEEVERSIAFKVTHRIR